MKRAWNRTFTSTQVESYYATIFRAAHHYYYKNIQGLNRPPKNSIWKTQIKIRALTRISNKRDGNFNSARHFLGITSPIYIYDSKRESQYIYGTVMHELAHASHWSRGRWVFHATDDYVIESWARGVQLVLTRMVYGTDYTIKFNPNKPKYTLVVMDMMDDEKNNTKVTESVSGYTISQIEDALIGKKTWNGWRNNIKAKYHNSTESQLDALFAAWK